MSTKFSHRTTVSARKPASFWREKTCYRHHFTMRVCKNVVMSKQVNNTVHVVVLALIFLISKKAQVTAIRITEQPILLTKSKINRTGYKSS